MVLNTGAEGSAGRDARVTAALESYYVVANVTFETGFDEGNGRADMLDHIFLTVSDVERSIAFYTAALAPLGINKCHDYDGKDGPPGHPDLKGFGAKGRVFFWLKQGQADSRAAHVGFVANSQSEVDAAYAAAMAAGAADNGAPSARLYYDPRYYAANVLDPDGYSLEFVYKSWQH
jgi:catechol 2,3-dioxygenase-like lactoylglutathione lyase family enzyme